MTDRHPSYLELDRHALGAAAAQTTAHVAGCERCRLYVESVPNAGELPAWLAAAPSPRRARHDRLARARNRAPRPRRWALAVGGLAAAAALLFAVLRPVPRDDAYDGVKGTPSVGVYVLRAGRVGLWDGTPLVAGDRIRLEVTPEQFRRVSVFSLDRDERPRGLYTGVVNPHARSMLPKAWQLDAAPGPEQLAIFFSDMEISAPAAEVLLEAHDPRQIWLLRLSLPKTTEAGVGP
jgi:hypothetical protein